MLTCLFQKKVNEQSRHVALFREKAFGKETILTASVPQKPIALSAVSKKLTESFARRFFSSSE